MKLNFHKDTVRFNVLLVQMLALIVSEVIGIPRRTLVHK